VFCSSKHSGSDKMRVEIMHGNSGPRYYTYSVGSGSSNAAKPGDDVEFLEQQEMDIAATTEMGVDELFAEPTPPTELLATEEQDPFQGTAGTTLDSAILNSVQDDNLRQSSEFSLTAPSSSVLLPTYNRRTLRTGILHFGVGGFFRAHQLVYMDYLLRHNIDQNRNWAYTGIGVLPNDRTMRDSLKSQDFLYTVIAHSASAVSSSGYSEEDLRSENDLKENVRVVAAMKDMVMAPEEPGEVMRMMADEDVKIFSLTITEFGYTVPPSKADLLLLQAAKRAATCPWAEMNDDRAKYSGATAIGLIVAGLAARRSSGTGGATVMSCDNIPGNGDYIREKVLERAEAAGDGLKEWIQFNCTFPNSMVDRITPMTSDRVRMQLAEKHGIQDRWPVACETFAQWVIEDNFAEGLSGRPRWEEVGVQLVEDVKPYELAKIRMLNVIHSVMVFPALLMGFEYIFEASTNSITRQYFKYVMEKEIRPALEGIPGIEAINLDKYQEILIERFGNVLVADTLMRVAQDTSDKFSVQGYPATSDGLSLGLKMEGMAFMVACWGHFIRKCKRAGLPIKDGKAAILEEAMKADDIRPLLDIEPIFHDLLFEDEWREAVVRYYDMIKYMGIRQALKTFNKEHISPVMG